MSRVLVIGKIHPAGLEILHGRPGLTVIALEDPGAPVPPGEIARADAILIRYGVLSEEAVRAAPNLRVVSRHGVGCDNLPVAALSARGIPVTIVGPVSAVSVAEQVIAMMLAASKRLGAYDAAVRAGNWSIRDSIGTFEIHGKTLLLLGFGRIGREVAQRAVALGMRVLAHDPGVDAADMRSAGVEAAGDWHARLPELDFLSLHVPLAPSTRNLVDAAVLERLKPTAVIVNAARGGLVDEEALHRALTTRLVDGAAALDTFAEEPLDANHPLCRLPNVILSPHSAALTREASMRMGVVAAQNVLAGLDGTLDPALIFNRRALEAIPDRAVSKA
ncbi:MAG: hydroxyacid dehydrogenase [Gammaproteobacteria bacterium]|nr:hydroxyacid dehydrogenase [Gammaproteobacteria bacterium]